MENGEEAESGSAVESESETESGTAMESEPETETEAIPVQPEKLPQTSVGTEEGCEEGALPEKETLKTPDTELVDEPEQDGIFVPDEEDRLLDALPEDDFLSTPELLERPEGGMQLPEGSDLSGIPDAGGNQMPDGTTETESEKEGNGDTDPDRESGQAEEMETQGGLEENEAMEENGATEELSETAGDRGAGENSEPEESSGALPETGTEIEEETEHPKESEKKKEGKIVRGKHYDIVGDEGAYYRDEADRLWIREGSSLHIKTRAKSGFDKASGLENLSQDGIFSFCLQKTDESGAVLEKSELKQETYFVDGEAPPADIAVSGEVTEGISYAANAARVSVIVAPDGKSGLGSVAYRVIRCEKDGRLTEDPKQGEWTSCSSDQEIEIAEEGLFQIFVRTKDNVGNTNFSKSTVVCVDRTPPELRIGGVEDQTANSGPVKIRVEGKDAYYKPGSLQVELIGKNTGKSPAVNRKKERKDGAVTEFFDFPDQKSYDDVYRLSVKAEDLAGNKAQKEYEFSVNRYGSVYDLAQETQRDLKKYFLSKAVPVVFYETNIDYIGESQIHCRRDGELRSLVKGRDYSVTMQGSRDSWKRYCYTIPAEYFDEEGIYELLLASGDRAKNRSDTGIQKKQVSFVLDRTAPDCVISGIEENGTYQGKSVTVYLTPNDNMGICRMKVYRNSKLLLSKGELAKEERTIRICLEAEDAWQTLQVFLEDRAGNAYWSREIPVYISERTGKTPEYRKVRASAQESEQEEKERKKVRSAKAGLSVRRIQKEMKQAVLNQGGRLVSGSLSPAVGSGEKRMPEGSAILLFGALVFCLTSLSYVISVRRKTGGRK